MKRAAVCLLRRAPEEVLPVWAGVISVHMVVELRILDEWIVDCSESYVAYNLDQ